MKRKIKTPIGVFLFKINLFKPLYNGDIMKDYSIWLDEVKRKKYKKLNKDEECDILIIGGGITGFSCAYFLKDLKKKIILVDANKICTGTTAKSTGKLTYLQEDYLNKMTSIYDKNVVLNYIESQKYAIKLAKKIIIENKIDCNFESVNSYIFSNSHINKFKIYDLYNNFKNNFNIKLVKKMPFKTKCLVALEGNDSYVFNPVKFILGLANVVENNISIFENTRIINLKNEKDFFSCSTNKFNIKAKKVILACHYPFFIFPYLFPLKTSIEKSYIVAGKTLSEKKISAINIDKNLLSFRFYKNKDNYILNVVENSKLYKNVNDLQKRNDAIWYMKSNFTPDIKYCWSNHDIMTSDYLPLIGKIEENLYLATGYNTWGMTNGILAGKIISDFIINKKNIYSDIFNPLRSFNNIPKMLLNNCSNGFAFMDSKLIKNKSFYNKNVKIINENGIDYGIYIDEKNVEHKVYNLCPHMKCNLYFNYQTKTWDCPCHGSSFDIDGNLIFGPASFNIKIKNSK